MIAAGILEEELKFGEDPGDYCQFACRGKAGRQMWSIEATHFYSVNLALPAHIDPDRRGRIPNYYVRSLPASAEQTRGSQLIVGSTQLGGTMVEIPTDLLATKEELFVLLDPSAQLNFVHSSATAANGVLDKNSCVISA